MTKSDRNGDGWVLDIMTSICKARDSFETLKEDGGFCYINAVNKDGLKSICFKLHNGFTMILNQKVSYGRGCGENIIL